ncbi:MAG: hypothetical protein PHV34_11725 [Verrucomicrobiae bacterium]|nr:hypothetical protein [Verrucomicrobiae bacterium]
MPIETIEGLFKPGIPAIGTQVNAETFDRIREMGKTKKAELVGWINSVTENNMETICKDSIQCPIPSFSFNSQTSSFTMTGFEYKDLGMILKYKPAIADDRRTIRMNVELFYSGTPEPESELNALKIDHTKPQEVPAFQVKAINTSISLLDNKTIVLTLFDPLRTKKTGAGGMQQKILVLLTVRAFTPSGHPLN